MFSKWMPLWCTKLFAGSHRCLLHFLLCFYNHLGSFSTYSWPFILQRQMAEGKSDWILFQSYSSGRHVRIIYPSSWNLLSARPTFHFAWICSWFCFLAGTVNTWLYFLQQIWEMFWNALSNSRTISFNFSCRERLNISPETPFFMMLCFLQGLILWLSECFWMSPRTLAAF